MPSEGDNKNKANDDDDGSRQKELAEEVIQGDRLIFNKVDIKAEKVISKNEAIIFFLFTFFFLFIIFIQLGIANSFMINDSIRKSINDWEGNEPFEEIQTLEDFVEFYKGYIELLYDEYHYNDYQKSDDELYSIKNLNYVVSTLRLTQRRVKLVDNDSPISKKYIKKVWAGDGIVYDDDKQSFEYTDTYGDTSEFIFDSDLSYEKKGGYVLNIDIYNSTYDESIARIDNAIDNGWLDDVTTSLLLDFVVYNPYLDIIMYTRLVVTAESSGRLMTKVQTDALKRTYYGNTLDYFRAVCECLFLIICIFYVIRKIYEIYEEYLQIQKQFFKDRKKKEYKEREERRKREEEDKKHMIDQVEDDSEDEDEDGQDKKKNKTKCNCGKSCRDVVLGVTTFTKGIFKFLSDPWNFIDCANIIILVISILVWMIFIANHNGDIKMKSLSYFQDSTHNNDILKISNLLTLYQRTVSLNLILISFKVLKYLGALFERVTVMFKVLSHAQSDIIYFFALYLIIFISFTTTFHIFYGSQVDRFSTYGDSFNTLFLYLGRNILRIEEMKEIYFIIFITSMEFILMNMFIAIIALSYSTVNKQLKDNETNNTEKLLKKKHILVTLYDMGKNMAKFGYLAKCFKKTKKDKDVDKAQIPDVNDQPSEEESKNNDGKSIESPNSSPKKQRSSKKSKSGKKSKNDKSEGEEVDLKEIKLDFNEEQKDKKSDSDEDKKKYTDTHGESSTKKNQSSMDVVSAVEKSGVEHEDEDLSENLEDDKDQNEDKKVENPEEDKENRRILEKVEIWDQKFTPNYFIDDDYADVKLESEKKAYERQVKREKKLGKDLWSLIIYIAFFAIFSYLTFAHVRVSMFNMYNDALKNNIEGVTIESSDEYINITQAKTYQQVADWIGNALYYEIVDTYTIGNDAETYYYFVNDYNYILESNFRVCFRLAKQDENPNKDVGPKPRLWDREDLDDENNFNKTTFEGSYSEFIYKYQDDGYRNEGSYCLNVDIDYLYYYMLWFIEDKIIGDQMLFLSIELVTYEASNYFYTYSAIYFDFMNNGDITASLDIASLDIRKYDEWYHWIRMVFEIIFMLSVFYMMFNFVRSIFKKLKMYNEWEKREIKTLSKIQRDQRHKKEPEFMRRLWAVVDFFTIFEVLFYIFSVVIMIMWIVFNVKYQKLKDDYPDDDLNSMYNDFYAGKVLFDDYKIILSLASICISFNLLSHIFMLNHFLADSKMEIIYFLIFYIILILGFVSMSHLTFGPYIEEYHTFGDAMVECFSIILGDFDFLALEEVNSFMAVMFFYPYNLMFVFILANMLLAIMNTAYIESNAKKKKTQKNKVRWLRVIAFCLFRDKKGEGEAHKTNQDPNAQVNNQKAEEHMFNHTQDIDAPDYLANLEKLGIYSRKEEDYKLWAINCAEEIRQENMDRAKLKRECYQALNNSDKDPTKMITARIKYWNYLRRAIQIIDMQNGVIEHQNQKLSEKLEAKNKEYELERENTDKMYLYISKLEEPVADNLQIVKHCISLKKKLDQYEKLKMNYLELQKSP